MIFIAPLISNISSKSLRRKRQLLFPCIDPFKIHSFLTLSRQSNLRNFYHSDKYARTDLLQSLFKDSSSTWLSVSLAVKERKPAKINFLFKTYLKKTVGSVGEAEVIEETERNESEEASGT